MVYHLEILIETNLSFLKILILILLFVIDILPVMAKAF
jgi:hypothetical protein